MNAPPSVASRSSTLVLLVAGDTACDSLQLQLSDAGYTVLAAGNCNEACRVLDDEPQVQVILTDVLLPDGPWDVILEAVGRRQSLAQVVVILRGAIDKGYIDQHLDILETGAYDVLAEPGIPEALQSVVAAAAAAASSNPRA